MKKFILPLCLLSLVVVLAAVPFVPTSYGTLATATAVDDRPLLPEEPYEYADPLLPSYLVDNNNGNGDHYNPPTTLTNGGARLGRVLFYDKRLSKNLKISCASCHLAQFGFSDTAVFSRGFEGQTTSRQSMGLTNARIQPSRSFFWDGTAHVLQEQISMAITSSIEMGMDFAEVENRLRETDFYPGLFADAFGDPAIHEGRITAAIGQFVRSMVGKNSKFDLAAVQEDKFFPPFETYSQLENDGYQLFIDLECNSCHRAPHFASGELSNNGLDLTNDKDKGHGERTPNNPYDDGLFKAPQLRNVELTPPYMHDGRFATLEQVIEHYNSGIQANPALSGHLMELDGTPRPRRMKLSEYDKQALVAFLKTLTDRHFIEDPRFEDPFTLTEVKDLPVTPMDRILHRKLFGNPGQEARQVKVFPNPFIDNLNIQLENPSQLEVSIEIVDLSGRVVFRQTDNGDSFKIPRGSLLAGSYVINIRSVIHNWSQILQVE